jgi:3,4-dihydroxy 2-butanone 4-phosphate synthase / GTP cyclohydrolase II
MPKAPQFDSIENVLADLRAGKMVIVTDDEDRENEGDIIMAAEKVTPKAVNFMATHARGLICVPMAEARADALGLEPMTRENRESHKTDFTVAVDAAKGISTGISAADRAKTIQILASPKSQPSDLVQPGHVFPLRAKQGGVLRRAGHTEAGVDLARMAGLQPAAVICEIMNADGTMARLPQLAAFKKKHKLRMCSIAAPTDYGSFDLHLYRSLVDGAHHVALVKGKISAKNSTLVRVHSECLTGDIFGSMRCDCGNQLHAALEQIEVEGNGVLLYMRQHEGRGIGLPAKIHAYKLQEQGLDTVEANLKLGFPAELRDYGVGAQILHDLGVRKMRFMTNNPKKVVGLDGYGLQIVKVVSIKSKPNPHNAKYLETKRLKMGHML